MTPEDRKYTQDHEWVQITGNIAKIGITDHAQHAMGDIVFCELPEVGQRIGAGESMGVVESVKAVSDIYCVVSGVVKEVNANLLDAPELLNQAPYEQFIAILEMEAVDEKLLMDAEAYDAFVREEAQ